MRDSYNNNNTSKEKEDKEKEEDIFVGGGRMSTGYEKKIRYLPTVPVFIPSKNRQSTAKVEETKEENKQYWVPDDHVQNCYSCGSKFLTLVNRKHHCRICGNIFCKHCFSTFYEENIYEEKRELKICSYCQDKCKELNKLIRDNFIYSNEGGKKKFETKTWEYVRSREEEDDPNRFCNFKPGQISQMTKFHENINDNYETLLRKMILKVLVEKTDKEKYPSLAQDWEETIFKLTKTVIDNVSPSFQDLNDSIDINEYIKIKTIPYEDKSKCEVIDGYAMQKNVSSKKMRQIIEDPKILLLCGSLEGRRTTENDAIVMKASAVEDYIEILRKKIESIKPQIIIVEKSASQKFQDFFSPENMNISLVTKCNIKKLERIARCVKTFVLPSADLIGQHILLGYCKIFKVETFKIKNESSSINKNNNLLFMRNNEYNLMKFEGCGKVLFNTVIISGPNKEELKEIKRLMKIITKTARFLYCQKFILRFFNMYYEPSLFKTNPNKKNKNLNSQSNNNNENNKENEDEEEINNNKINMDHLGKNVGKNLGRNIINDHNSNENENQQDLMYECGFDTQILDSDENEFECVYTTMLNKKPSEKDTNIMLRSSMPITNDPSRETAANPMSLKESQVLKSVPTQCSACSYTMNAYSTDEKEEATLGQNICKLLEEGKDKCEKCGGAKINHTSYIYKDRGRIKISMFNLNDQLCKIDKVLDYLGFDDKLKENTLFLSKKENILNQEEIYSYGYCEICCEVVTPIVLLPKEIVNFSGTKFYQNLLYNHDLLNYFGNEERPLNFGCQGPESIMKICKEKQHKHYKDISRIFLTKNGAIKFQYEDVIKYKLLGSQLNAQNELNEKSCEEQKVKEILNDKKNTLMVLEAIKGKFFEHQKILKKMNSKIVSPNITSVLRIVDDSVKKIDELIKKNTSDEIFKPGEYENIYKYYVVLKRYLLKIMNMKVMSNKITKLVKKLMKIIFFEECQEMNRILREQEMKNIAMSDETDDIAMLIGNEKENLERKYYPQNSFKLTSSSLKKKNFQNFLGGEENNSNLRHSLAPNFINNHLGKRKKSDSFNIKKSSSESFKKNVAEALEDKGKIDIDLRELRDEKGSKLTDEVAEENYFDENEEKEEEEDDNKNKSNGEKEGGNIKVIGDKSEEDGEEEVAFNKDNFKESFKIGEREKDRDTDEAVREMTLNNSIGVSYNSELKKKMKEKFDLCEKEMRSYFNNIEELDNDLNVQEIIEKLNFYDKKHNYLSGEVNEDDLCSLITYALTSDQYLDLIKIDNKNGLNEIKRHLKKNVFEEGDNRLFCNTSLLYDRENIKFSLGDFPEEKIYQILGSDLLSNDNKKYQFEVNYNQNNVFNEAFEKKDEEELKSSHKIKYHELNSFFYSSNNKIQMIQSDLDSIIKEKFEEFAKKYKFPKTNFHDKDKTVQELKITAFYPKQFEALRILYCASYNEFINSISKSHEWSSVTGGKSKARFFNSNDERFVVKCLNETEFRMFIESCFHYFIHNNKYFFFKMPSSLVKILGAYKVRVKPKKVNRFCVIMENLNYLLKEENGLFKVTYDLKGSANNRYVKEKENGRVLMDTNFLEDFNGEPLVLDQKIYTLFLCAISNDTKICRTMGVIDYSLLCVIVEFLDKEKNKEESKDDKNTNDGENPNRNNSRKTKVIRLGVLDYFRKYTWDKHLETFGKTIMHKFTAPTIISPKKYDERFFKKLSSYFIGA